ncbi:MAG: TlpA disulfide reductase family protein [Kiritimatiellaeota bacterium]|nr:TlpA disulfide reductase family protein [Kiritimatiellota bacterium]
MKHKLIVSILAAALLAPAIIQAQTTDGTRPAPSAVQTELAAIVKDVRLKLKEKQGKATAADLADNFKAFDALIAKHADEKTDEMAHVAYMKAMLYDQVLNDKTTAEKLIKQMQADYKGTKYMENFAQQRAMKAEADKMQAKLAPGLPFPDFNEKDLAGQPLSVSNFKGKVVLVDFWATWCGPCVGELPNVIATYKKYHSDGFEIIGISLDSSREKLDAFIKSHDGMTWQQYFDGQGWKNKLAGQYGVHGIPFTVLVGPDGKILGKGLRGEALGEAVGKALKR